MRRKNVPQQGGYSKTFWKRMTILFDATATAIAIWGLKIIGITSDVIKIGDSGHIILGLVLLATAATIYIVTTFVLEEVVRSGREVE